MLTGDGITRLACHVLHDLDRPTRGGDVLQYTRKVSLILDLPGDLGQLWLDILHVSLGGWLVKLIFPPCSSAGVIGGDLNVLA
jgi:hypothetical protein